MPRAEHVVGMVILAMSPVSSQPRLQAAPSYDFRALKILVVEDHADSLELFVTILEQLGATVLAASTVKQAFELLTLHRPQLVVSDISLPDEDGHSFLRRIRSLPAAAGGATPAIAVTAHSTFRDRRDALTAGFDTYLAKPVDIARLCEAIEQLVQGPSSPVR